MTTPIRAAALALAGLALLPLLAGCGGGGGDDAPDEPSNGGADPLVVRFHAQGSSAQTVSLGWTAVPGASGYTVERKTVGGTYTPVATLGAGASRYLDTGLQGSTAYTYRLVAAGTAAPASAEQNATTSDEPALTTPAAAPTGAAIVEAVGGAGGRITSADGEIVVDVPAGALADGSELRLQPIANPVPDGFGAGARLQVVGTLTKPIALKLAYPQDMAAHADGLGVALRRADGGWTAMPLAQIDKTTRTLTLQLGADDATGTAGKQAAKAGAAADVSIDFEVIRYLDFHLSPKEASVRTGETRRLVPYARTRGVIGHICYPDEDLGCLPSPLMDTKEIPFENSKAGYSRKWYVFAEEGGDATSGTITPTGAVGANYKAPAEVPDPNPVIVSFVSVHTKSGRSLTLSSRITVTAPVWTGTVNGLLSVPGGDLGFKFTAEGVWTPVAGSQGTRFSATGTQTLTVIPMGCTGVVSPATVALPPGALVIDESTNPASYSLDVGSIWSTVLTGSCPGGGSGSVAFDVPGRLVIEGTLTRDGSTLEGFASLNGVAWDWALSRQP